MRFYFLALSYGVACRQQKSTQIPHRPFRSVKKSFDKTVELPKRRCLIGIIGIFAII
ncbi:MAG: hypothetical protein LBH45_02355 [Campylobacteraceae bacterium]|nr:hypothetical protein [Campylobacteraceae bacterium]